MKNSLVLKSIVAVGLTVCSMASSNAQVVTTSQVLFGGTRCDNVIHLMHMYGVNNSVDRADMVHGYPFGAAVIPGAEIGDLQIMHVNQVTHDDPALGPQIAVGIKNCSARKVCNFHVTAVAIFGHIRPFSPCGTVQVAEILPGEIFEVCIQLPIEALAMGNRNGQVLGFQRLVVAIDSFDVMLETNEANNLQAFDAAQLPIAAATVTEEVVETVPAQAAGTMTETTETQVEVTETTEAAPVATNNVQPPAAENTDALGSAIERLGDGGTGANVAP